MVEVQRVDAEPIHLPVALTDEPAAFAAQDFEIARRHDAFEDEEPVVVEATSVLTCIHICSPCWRLADAPASLARFHLVAPQIPIVSCDARGSRSPPRCRRACRPSPRLPRITARPPACRARAQPRGTRKRVLPAGRAALPALARHADVALS